MGSQFDDLALAYESTAVDMAVRQHLEYPSYFEALGDITGLKVLDLGCGSGVYSRRLRSHGAQRVVGADVSEGMLDYARSRERREQLGIDYLRRDITRPIDAPDPELDGAFDLVAGVYVAPYAPTVEALHGLFRTARRALPASGGRCVTYVLNPEAAVTPGYYAEYDFELVAVDGGQQVPDGAPLTLTITLPEHPTFSLTAYRWSRATQEDAARAAGFESLQWIHPKVTDEGLALHGASYWKRYLDCPHTLILSCVAAPQTEGK
ncbi:class I SAM-dependent methyltransferase [Streptomyces sp. NPDC007205]|uniref:class I SAM-dependent methyltransferase n=1 Tax=Streptomyces sp. NPDC007205 TaxID=3154316 RepID=UPI003408A726